MSDQSFSPAKQFLKSRGRTASSEPVKIHLVDDSGTQQTEAEGAPAVFRFVTDRVKAEADADAARALAGLESKGGASVPDEVRAAYEQSYFLHAALRNPADPISPFFDGADEARGMLLPSERLRLIAAYQAWIEVKFPSDFDSPKFKEAMADAESFTVGALLTKYGYAITRNCVISSAVILSRSPTTT